MAANKQTGGQRKRAPTKRAASQRTAALERAEAAALAGVTPLEVMLHAMRERYQAKDYAKAADLAKDAAPYVHPRLTSVDSKLSHNVSYTPVHVSERDPIGPVDAPAGPADLGDPAASRH